MSNLGLFLFECGRSAEAQAVDNASDPERLFLD
jgi:hypothetical protein